MFFQRNIFNCYTIYLVSGINHFYLYYDNISELINREIKLPTIYLTNSNVVVDDTHRLDPYDYGYLFFKKEQVFATLIF